MCKCKNVQFIKLFQILKTEHFYREGTNLPAHDKSMQKLRNRIFG